MTIIELPMAFFDDRDIIYTYVVVINRLESLDRTNTTHFTFAGLII